MHIVLFEDHLTGENRPLTLPRPAFGVSVAATRLFEAARSYATGVSAIVRPYLAALAKESFELAALPRNDVLLVNASLAPSFELLDQLTKEAKEGDFIAKADSRVAAAYFKSAPKGLAEQDAQGITAFLASQQARQIQHALPLIGLPCDVIRYHQKFFGENMKRLTEGLVEFQPGVFTGRDVKIHPSAVFDTHDGPIVLRDNVTVGPFAFLIGPVMVDHHTKIIERATIKEQLQIGHHCKIGGEVECSIFEPYTNKQHHGFLGHGYVGSWVNVGAGTSNSDLKNTYGEVSMVHRGRKVATGMQFMGCIIGDYSKTAINTSIFTGKVVGVSSYLYGFIGTNVPSFTNYARTFGQITEFVLESAIKTQGRMFGRRNFEQTPTMVKLMEDMYELTRDERLMSTEQVAL